MNSSDIARHWAERGFKVFPITRETKKPLLPWKENATDDPGLAAMMFSGEPIFCTDSYGETGLDSFGSAAVGMVIPEDVVVVDLDVKKGKDGITKWAKLGQGFDTMSVETPSGGRHLYYRTPVPIKNTVDKLGEGVDTRGGGLGFCVAPGQLGYTEATDTPMAPVPDIVTRDPDMHRGSREAWGQGIPYDEADSPEALKAAEAYMKVMHERAEDEGYGPGNRDTFVNRVLNALYAMGISRETAEAHIIHLDGEVGDGGYEDLDRNLHSVYEGASATQEFGAERDKFIAAYTNSSSVEGLVAEALADRAEKINAAAKEFAWITSADAERSARVDWLVKGWLPAASMGLLFGPYGTKKTFMALDLALSLASEGVPQWAGVPIPEEAKTVLYVPGEGMADLGYRLKAWRSWHGREEAAKGFYVASAVPRVMEDEHILGFLAASEGRAAPDLVVFDTMYYTMLGYNENDSKEVMLFLDRLTRFVRSKWPQTTILMVGHTAKGSEDELRGAVAMPAAMDFSIQITKSENGLGRMRLTKQKAGRTDLPAVYFEAREEAVGVDDDGEEILSLALAYTESRRGPSSKAELEARERLQGDVLWELLSEELLKTPDEMVAVKVLIRTVAEEFAKRVYEEVTPDTVAMAQQSMAKR